MAGDRDGNGSLDGVRRGSGGSSPTTPVPAPPNANLGGSCNATITASSTCSANVPSETRVLNYVADISRTGAELHLFERLV
jgi:hypothetical protein